MAKRVGLTPKVDERSNVRGAGTIEELEEGLRIDEHALDDALVDQPELFYRVSKRLTLMVSQRDAKKQELAEEEAKADGEIRETAFNEKEKLTESEVKNMIRLDRAVRKVSGEFMELNREVGQLTALKEAFSQRSYVLKDLVKLYIANYYESTAEDGSSARRELRDHSASRVRGELKTRRQNYERD